LLCWGPPTAIVNRRPIPPCRDRGARVSSTVVDAGRKLDVVRAAAMHEFPVADIEQMLEEVERGYLDEIG
jgi:hypothetical protein